MTETMPSTNLKVKSGLLRKIHRRVVENYPNEFAALIVGYREEGWEVASDLLNIKIIKATPQFVQFDSNDIFDKMKKFYVIGQLHSHPYPEPWSGSTIASSEDHKSWHSFLKYSFETYGRRPYVFIYAYPPGILNVYKDHKPVKYLVIN